MKIAIAQLNFHVGNFESNTAKIIERIKEAKGAGANLVVFPELAVCGYPPRDFLEFDDFINRCENTIATIQKETQGIYVVVGSPTRNTTGHGKPLFNSAYILGDGEQIGTVHKTLLPTYDIFDEYRYFEPNRTFEVVEILGEKIGVAICEDLWNVDNNPLYTQSPIDELVQLGAERIINIAASPFHVEQSKLRRQVLAKNASKSGLPIVYANHVGAQTELIFDGGSFFMNAQGVIQNQLPFFKEGLLFSDESNEVSDLTKIEGIHDALIMGVKDYFKKLGFTKAVVGVEWRN